jgi:hypothetical protein
VCSSDLVGIFDEYDAFQNGDRYEWRGELYEGPLGLDTVSRLAAITHEMFSRGIRQGLGESGDLFVGGVPTPLAVEEFCRKNVPYRMGR